MDPSYSASAQELDPAVLWNDDPRLRDHLTPALLPETAGVRELSTFLSDPVHHEQLKACVAAVHAELIRQRSQTIEEAAREIFALADLAFHQQGPLGRKRSKVCAAEVIAALLLRYGLTGEPPATLDDMGHAIGRTRERARQIQNMHDRALRSTRPSWPSLDQALKVACSVVPCSEDDLADHLIHSNLTSIRYSMKSLKACAEFAGREFSLEEADGIVSVSSAELAAVARATRVLTSRQGLASPLQITDELVDDGIIISESDVKANLLEVPGVVWLDDMHVTWSNASRNRLVNTLKTMLSVHQPVGLDTTIRVINDFWGYRNAGRPANQRELTTPTPQGLRSFCSWHPDFSLVATEAAEGIRSTVPLDPETELGLEAAMLVELIRSAPDAAMDRVTLLEAAEAVGMRSGTVGTYLSFHPAFTNPARNVWTTLGTQLTPGILRNIQQLAQQRSRSEARDFVTGTTADDHPWVALAVTSNLRMSGVLLRRWLPADAPSLRLSAIDQLGDPCGMVVFNAGSGFTHGLGTYLRRFAIRVGEFLLITADMDWETAQIRRGDRQLLDGPTT